jgi:hypothetical protein
MNQSCLLSTFCNFVRLLQCVMLRVVYAVVQCVVYADDVLRLCFVVMLLMRFVCVAQFVKIFCCFLFRCDFVVR